MRARRFARANTRQTDEAIGLAALDPDAQPILRVRSARRTHSRLPHRGTEGEANRTDRNANFRWPARRLTLEVASTNIQPWPLSNSCFSLGDAGLGPRNVASIASANCGEEIVPISCPLTITVAPCCSKSRE